MENFELVIEKHDNFGESLGISEERHVEFAESAAEIMQKHIVGELGLADALKELIKDCQSPNEVVFFVYAFGSSLEKASSEIKMKMMSKLFS